MTIAIFVVLCLSLFVACNRLVFSPASGSITLTITVPTLIENTRTKSVSRAVLDMAEQSMSLTVTCGSEKGIRKNLIYNEFNKTFSGTIDVIYGKAYTFTIEAKDAAGTVYAKGVQEQRIEKIREAITITLVPIIPEGIEEQTTVDVAYTSEALEAGVVSFIRFTPSLESPTVYTYSAPGFSFVVCDEAGRVLTNENNEWTMKSEDAVIFIFAKTEDSANLSIKTFPKPSNLTYYIGATNEGNNSGLNPDAPITLDDAILRANSFFNITAKNPVQCIITDNIDVQKLPTITTHICMKPHGENNVSIALSETIEQSLCTIGDVSNAASLSLLNVTINIVDGEPTNSFSAKGGLIRVENGSLTLGTDTVVTGNKIKTSQLDEDTSYGGGVYVATAGTLILDGGDIKDCSADYGGGVYVATAGTLTLESGCFATNEASSGNDFYIENYSLDNLIVTGSPVGHYDDLKTDLDGFGITISNIEVAINTHLFKGTGKEADPYLVSQKSDINGMRFLPQAIITGTYFRQTADIDMNGVNQFQGIPEFYAEYDGNYKCIKNLSIESSTTSFGMFQKIENAHIKKVVLTGATITYGYNGSSDNCGILVGEARNSTIEKCGVAAESSIHNTSDKFTAEDGKTGGLIGFATNCTIDECFADVNLSAVNHTHRVGGLIGQVTKGSITNCYTAMDEISNNNSSAKFVGSLVGYVEEDVRISSSYTCGSSKGENTASRGFIGGPVVGTTLEQTATYEGEETTEGMSGIAALAIFDAGSENQTLFDDFDTSIWTIDIGTYPYLLWHKSLYEPLVTSTLP